MKINIKIWIGIILLSALVIVFRNFNFQLNKKYLIARAFHDNSSRAIKNPFIESLNISTIYSDKMICRYDLKNIDTGKNRCSVKTYDILSYHLLDSFSFSIPKTAQVRYCTTGKIYYTDKFGLYSYDPMTKKVDELNSTRFKCLNISQVNTNTLLLFGEMHTDSVFKTGYFTIDLATKEIKLSKLLEENKSTVAAPNWLIYAGKFIRIDSATICYYCDKYCKIFFFNNDGHFVKEFTTEDQTPKPSLVSTGEAFFYRRGSTFNVNNAIYLKKDTLFVFSCRSRPANYLLIDKYSLTTNKYLYSTQLPYKDWNDQDIISVSNSGGNAIINFQDGVGLFQL